MIDPIQLVSLDNLSSVSSSAIIRISNGKRIGVKDETQTNKQKRQTNDEQCSWAGIQCDTDFFFWWRWDHYSYQDEQKKKLGRILETGFNLKKKKKSKNNHKNQITMNWKGYNVIFDSGVVI